MPSGECTSTRDRPAGGNTGRLFLTFGGPVCADRISNCPLDRVLTYKNLIYLLNLQIYSKDANFALFDHQNEDLYQKLKQNVCGGQRMKSGERTCVKILGFDAITLYPYCLHKEMPCSAFVGRRES